MAEENDELLCPCGSGKTYAECCEPIVTEAKLATTAEEVMRARYSAYVKGGVAFIVSSTHPQRRAECDEKAIRAWSENSEWLGFEILSSEKGSANDDEGHVEFTAQFTEERMKKKLHETAEFQKVDGAWYYLDSKVHPPKPFKKPDEERVNRNDPCPCGSGKKYKKCCMDKTK